MISQSEFHLSIQLCMSFHTHSTPEVFGLRRTSLHAKIFYFARKIKIQMTFQHFNHFSHGLSSSPLNLFPRLAFLQALLQSNVTFHWRIVLKVCDEWGSISLPLHPCTKGVFTEVCYSGFCPPSIARTRHKLRQIFVFKNNNDTRFVRPSYMLQRNLLSQN